MFKKTPTWGKNIPKKCRICGQPTFHDVCYKCKEKAENDEKQRNKRRPWEREPIFSSDRKIPDDSINVEKKKSRPRQFIERA